MTGTATRLGVLGPAAAVLGYVGAVLCLVVGSVLLLAPRPDPVPLQDGVAVVPGARLLHPGTGVLVAEGTDRDLVGGFACEATTGDGVTVDSFFQDILPEDVELPDGSAGEQVLTATRVHGGDTVRCPGAVGTQAWVAQDSAARVVSAVAALVAAPLVAVAATVLLVVGLMSRRRA